MFQAGGEGEGITIIKRCRCSPMLALSTMTINYELYKLSIIRIRS